MRSKNNKPSKKSKLSRKKIRKHKLLSLLRLQPGQELAEKKDDMSLEMTKKQQLINLFPLQPENLVAYDDKDNSQYDNVSLLFNTADNATLNGLLDDGTTTSEEGPPLSSSPSYGCRDGGALLRTAMRGRERRDVGEEKWVRYWELVGEEVSSRYGGGGEEEVDGRWWCGEKKCLDLKLDYGEILKAWSDKGPLYVGGDGGESPQTVPDLPSLAHVAMEGWNPNSKMWRVPEMLACKEEIMENEGRKKGQREASVLRYKEKRLSRLFSKRIRYQVRKLNAEKRPRLKGRFVKRD